MSQDEGYYVLNPVRMCAFARDAVCFVRVRTGRDRSLTKSVEHRRRLSGCFCVKTFYL